MSRRAPRRYARRDKSPRRSRPQGRYLDPAIGGWALTSDSDAALTERELEVLRLVALGHTNSEIASRMYISPRTVETHRANLQTKLGIAGRPELVRYALEHGVIHR